MAKFIDRAPPALTGDANRDVKALREYLVYLREQYNFNLSQLYKQQQTTGEG